MTSPEAGSARTGLTLILASTVVAGAAGYIVQALVPAFSEQSDYLTFTVTWSAMYLVVAAVAGLQQEVTRAASPRLGSASPRRVLMTFTVTAAAVCAVAVLATSFLWAPAAFGAEAVAVMPSILVGTVGYVLVAVLSGVFYGARRWRAVAGMTVVDSLLRLTTVTTVVALGLTGSAYAWAIALPFLGSFAVLWVIDGRRAVNEIRLDAPLSTLARNSVSTVGAALATGVMISGLPLVLGVTSTGLGDTTLAAVILVITLTRAPLIIPLLALQSYLVVTFRDGPRLAARRTLVWGGMLLGVTATLSVASVVVGPWVVELLYHGRYQLAPGVYAVIVASAGLTALLCLTGPAALARGRHRSYVAGWSMSSVALLAGLALAPSDVWATVGVIACAPLLGAAVHLWALRGGPGQLAAEG